MGLMKPGQTPGVPQVGQGYASSRLDWNLTVK